jgi:hypothetical protein
MSAERNQYSSSILVSQKPIDATEIVRVRLSQAKLLNDEFSNFFKRYYGIKSNYLNELNKLVNQTEDLNKNIEHSIIENQVLSTEELKHYNVDAIGNLSEIWNDIISEIKDEISANNQLRTVVEKEVIHPLTGFTTKNKQWSDVRQLHSQLSEVAQTIEYNQEKLDKYANTPNKSLDKQEKYQTALQNANATWDSQAPYVFEVFENTDFSRLEFLRDSLLRFITAYTDSLNKISQSNEKTLETILNFNPENEISRFAKVSSETTFIPKEARKAAESPAVQQNPTFGKPPSASSSGNRNFSVATAASAATTVTSKNGTSKDPQKKTRLRSKVGSIFGRKKKDKKKLNLGETVAESEASSVNELSAPPTRQSKASSFVSGHTNTFGQPPSSKQSALPDPVSKNSPAPPSDSKFPSSGQDSAPFSFNQAPLQPTSRSDSTSNFNSGTSNTSISEDPRNSSAGQSYPETKSPFNISPVKAQPAQVFNQSPLHQQQLQTPPSQKLPESPTRDNGSEHENGGQTHPIEHHKAPAPPPSRKVTSGAHNLGNIREDGSDYQPTPRTHQKDPTESQPATNRRDIQSQLFTNLNITGPDGSKRLSSFNSFGGESIRALNPQATGSSLIGPGGLFQHSTFNQPGLNASVAEVINAKFKDGEQVSAQIIGEMALYFNNDNDTIEVPGKTNLKIITNTGFDKVIPNQAFLKQIDADEFEILPNAVLGRTIGALKYSIKSTQAPIVVLPAWRFEAHQASVMLSIKLAPHVAALLGEGDEIYLSNLVVSVSIKGASNSALSKPQGTFNKEKSRITWRYKEPVKLTASSEEKLVARFLTDEEVTESDQGVLVKFSIDEGQGSKFVTSGIELQSHVFEEDDPFAQTSWSEVPSHKTLVSGNYSGSA